MARVIIPRVNQAPELELDLTQDVWKQAPWEGGFTVLGDPDNIGAEAFPQTSFCMVHDGESLYVAVKAEEPQLSRVKAVAADDPQVNEAVFTQDLFELFIDAESLSRSCAQLAFNSRGALVALWIRGYEAFLDWDSKARISTGSGVGFWSAQLSLPLEVLKFSPASGKWKFNLIRTRMVEGTDGKIEQSVSSFAPLPGMVYYNPPFFQPARVENLDFSRFLWTAEPVGSFTVSDKGKGLILRQPLRISNLSQQTRRAEIRCTLKVDDKPESRTWTISREFAPRQKREEVLEMPVPSEYFGNMSMVLTDPALRKQILSQIYFLEREELSWKEHPVLQGDGKGGHVCHPARFRFMPRFRGSVAPLPFGLAEMDDGEIIFAGYVEDHLSNYQSAVVAFSRDRGTTWSDYQPVEGCKGRPHMLVYLGSGRLAFTSEAKAPDRFESPDYGRTWKHICPAQPASNGRIFGQEGNPMADRDSSGIVTRIAEFGSTLAPGAWPEGPSEGFIRWSEDGGRTWINESRPEAWRWQAQHVGKTYSRSVCEGALVRAKNGWLVAALRTDLPPRYFKTPPVGNDNFCGTAISISKDDGKTWSPLDVLFEAGRMHGNLIRLPDGDLVLTVIRRIDLRDGKFAGYRRGCDAFVSHDHGLTWNLDRMYVLDDFAYVNGECWSSPSACGHLSSLPLDDGSVLTTYLNSVLSCVPLIHWRP